MRGAPRDTRSRVDLLRVRRRLRITQAEFARRFGLSASWVQEVERGHGGDDRKTHLLLLPPHARLTAQNTLVSCRGARLGR